jgi:hypothetical protein
MQSAAKKTITPEQWNSKLAEVNIAKEDMNKLVMNFLVTEVRQAAALRAVCTADPCPAAAQPLASHSCSSNTTTSMTFGLLYRMQGYVDAARMFQQESGTAPAVNLEQITDRMQIRQAVQAGRVEEAIDKVNDLNPEVRQHPLLRSGQVATAARSDQCGCLRHPTLLCSQDCRVEVYAGGTALTSCCVKLQPVE